MLTGRISRIGRAAGPLLLLAVTAAGCAGTAGESAPAAPQTVWCYRSLADAECYVRPEAQRPDGFIGTFAFAIPAAAAIVPAE